MIDRVIICGVRRANELVPVREIKQSIGRAGRSYSRPGEAYILSPDNDCSYAEKCIGEEAPPVKSELVSAENLAFHVLPWLDTVYDDKTFDTWFASSLAYVQGVKVGWKDVKTYLEENNCIKNGKITRFGQISVKKYFTPDRLTTIRNKMMEAYIDGYAGEISVISWMLSYKHISMGDVDVNELASYKNLLKTYGCYFTKGELIHGYIYNCILLNKRPKWIKHAIASEMEDIQRLFSACSMIADIENIPIQDKLNESIICAIKKVPPEIARIIDAFGFERKACAYELADMGITCKDDIKEREDYIVSYGTEGLKNELIKLGFLQNEIILNLRENNQKG